MSSQITPKPTHSESGAPEQKEPDTRASLTTSTSIPDLSLTELVRKRKELLRDIKELKEKNDVAERILNAMRDGEKADAIVERLHNGEAYEAILEDMERSASYEEGASVEHLSSVGARLHNEENLGSDARTKVENL